MERTKIRLGGIAIDSSVMNASGPRSAERDEIHELSTAHRGAVVFKSCNIAGLEQPENLKNHGVEYFAALAQELHEHHKIVVASVVGATEDEIVAVAQTLDRAGANILELNLADDYVINSVAPFASFERLKALVGRVRGETAAALAVKLPPRGLTFTPRAVADLMKSLRVSILVCANDLPKDFAKDIDLKRGLLKGPDRVLSQVNAYFREAEALLDIVAVGGVNTGRDAYIAHLTGAKAVQIGSALIKEGTTALGRIDRELDALLAENGHASVAEIIGTVSFSE
jgi:dihydroorotate dehydrogenase (fumarate)